MTAGCNERKIVRTVELRRRREERGGYTMDCTDESRDASDLSNIPATARSRRSAKKLTDASSSLKQQQQQLHKLQPRSPAPSQVHDLCTSFDSRPAPAPFDSHSVQLLSGAVNLASCDPSVWQLLAFWVQKFQSNAAARAECCLAFLGSLS